jgi:hypothetical protein
MENRARQLGSMGRISRRAEFIRRTASHHHWQHQHIRANSGKVAYDFFARHGQVIQVCYDEKGHITRVERHLPSQNRERLDTSHPGKAERVIGWLSKGSTPSVPVQNADH